MKKSKVLFMSIILLLTGIVISLTGNYLKSEPNYIVIKVHVTQGGGSVSGALVKCTGPGFGECQTTGPTGTLAFYTDNSGTYYLCASKNGYTYTTNIYVTGSGVDLEMPLSYTGGACEDCPGSK